MKKLHICMISSEFPPESAGIGNAVFQLAQGLLQKGHSVTVLTRGNAYKTHKNRVQGITVYKLPFIAFFPPFHILYHGFFLNKKLQEIEKEIDIVHAHSPLVPIIKTGKPLVITVHSTWHKEAEAFKNVTDWYSLAVKLFSPSFIRNEKRLYKKSTRFLAISEGMKHELTHFYAVASQKVAVIPNSINLRMYESIKPHTGDTKAEVVTVCRLVQRKGVLDLIKAAAIVCETYPNARFTIVGKGPLEKQMRILIRKLHLQNNVILTGEMPHAKIIDYLAKATLAVIPSHYEGLPLVLLETMACGKPIVATSIDGIRELINDRENGLLVPVQDPKKMADAIKLCLSSQQLQRKMSANAKKTILQFDQEKMINRTLLFYQEVLHATV